MSKRKKESNDEGVSSKKKQQTYDLQNHLLFTKTFNARAMIAKYPPKFKCVNKKLIYKMIPTDFEDYTISYSRYESIPFPPSIPKSLTNHVMQEDTYQYDPVPKASKRVEWHINFADYNLFGYYGGNLFAQDEMQVMEHPVLGSLREAVLALVGDYPAAVPFTRFKKYSQKINEPTPILIQGARRCVRVQVDINEGKGRPQGLYGNMFAFADDDVIERATAVINPPTITNLIAMEAPKGGKGRYTLTQIRDVFKTAFSSFACAVHETKAKSPSHKTVIHTGNWGTGAYGGNKVLMAFSQMFAADVAQVDELVFHTFDRSSSNDYKTAQEILQGMVTEHFEDVESVLKFIYDQEFRWGVGDGN